MKYDIIGSSMQILNINLNAGEKIYIDAGKMASKTDNVSLNAKWAGGAGFLKGIKMAFAGSSSFLLEGTAESDNGQIALAGVIPGKVKVIELKEGESVYVEHFAFLATTDPTKIDVKASIRGALGGAGLFLEKFDGPCVVFIHVSGDIVEYDLDAGSVLNVDPGHVATFDGNMQIQFTKVGNLKTELVSGEGLWLAKFAGPGKVVLHSVSRFALQRAIGGGNATAGTIASDANAANAVGGLLGDIFKGLGGSAGGKPGSFKL